MGTSTEVFLRLGYELLENSTLRHPNRTEKPLASLSRKTSKVGTAPPQRLDEPGAICVLLLEGHPLWQQVGGGREEAGMEDTRAARRGATC